MRIVLLCAVLISIVGIGSWFFFDTYGDIRNYPPKNARIVAFGDSLVFGQGATEGHDFVSELSTKIGRPIINLGVSGNTTADGVARIDDVLEVDPGLVLLLLGGNDTLRRIPVETTETNLRTIIERLEQNGSVVMFIGVRGGVLGSEREDMYERVSTEYGALYVDDILDGIFLKPELMHDGIHPNDQGYMRIADRLHTVFIENNL
jgi:lysophospholipase L1-like esterase